LGQGQTTSFPIGGVANLIPLRGEPFKGNHPLILGEKGLGIGSVGIGIRGNGKRLKGVKSSFKGKRG